MPEEKAKVVTRTTTEYFDIKDLAIKFETNTLVLAGVMNTNSWKQGKQLTEKEYQKAIKEFLEVSIGGGKLC